MHKKIGSHPMDCGAEAKTLEQKEVYTSATLLSRLQDLVTSLFIMANNPILDANDHNIAWSWFAQMLEHLVEIKHGV